MPKLSIITVNLNNATGLEKTMQSVFAQTFTDYEYIIIDGGSSDGSVEQIKKQENKLVYWISEKDKGVYSAMNKGIVKATGDYLLFLNSGDTLYTEQSLSHFFKHSNQEDIVYGDVYVIEKGREWIKTYPDKLSFGFFLRDSLHHQSSIIKKSVFEKTGLYDEDLKIVSDWKVSMNAICIDRVSYKHIDCCISTFPRDGFSSNPDNIELFKKERKVVVDQYYPLFIDDYQKAKETERKLEECEGTLRNIKASRSYQLLKKIAKSSLIKMVTKSNGFRK
jgi:glycosyltransferase involved in cell wall biosynthesis